MFGTYEECVQGCNLYSATPARDIETKLVIELKTAIEGDGAYLWKNIPLNKQRNHCICKWLSLYQNLERF